MVDKDLDIAVEQIILDFKEHANHKLAEGMQNYMKGNFKYLGLQKPLREKLQKAFIQECKKLGFSELEYIVKKLWKMPYREFQYLTIDLMRACKIWKHKECLELTEYLISQKAWWDSVDMLAIQVIGPYLKQLPELRKKKTAEWIKKPDLWFNRTAIIYQLKYKESTDLELLFSTLQHFLKSQEFFIQKAIGWALRELSYSYPEKVVQFCELNELKPLSKREALRVLKKKELA